MTKVREIKRFPKKDDSMYTETKEKINKAVKMYIVEKMDVPEIAKEMELSEKTIYYYLRVRNVVMRPQKRDNRGRFKSS